MKALSEIMRFLESIDIKTSGNADFSLISLDSFSVENARNLKSLSVEKSFSSSLSAQANKRIFIISTNNFLLEAQNTLLKMFEEPIEDVIFFLIVPDKNALLKTLASRFYVISLERALGEEAEMADKFLNMSLQKRVDFIKDLLIENEGEEEELEKSVRLKALKFLNALEHILHKKLVSRTVLDIGVFEHFFKVRKFLRMPGSSTKSLMESVAFLTPNL